MARLPRIVLPGIAHPITQRGNRRERTFFEDGDYTLYLDLLADAPRNAGVEIWSCCLMPNHVHIIAVSSDEDGLRRAFRYVHRHCTGYRLRGPPQSGAYRPARRFLAMDRGYGSKDRPHTQATEARASAAEYFGVFAPFTVIRRNSGSKIDGQDGTTQKEMAAALPFPACDRCALGCAVRSDG